MSETLAPCPFCGGEARIVHKQNLSWVRCVEIDCLASSFPHMIVDETVGKWNRRAESAERAALTKRVASLEASLEAERVRGDEGFLDIITANARIAELEAALAAATRYVPVEDGEYRFPNWDGKHTVVTVVKTDNGWTELEQWIDGFDRNNGDVVAFSSGYVVCRVAGEGEANNG